ncbi:MAG: TolC family protein [Flavobacteriales bacterium]|nr:TolC family protein [Flavobacteriales bacterium]
MKRILVDIILIALTGITPACAQSLRDMVDEALQNNYRIRIVKNDEKIAENNNTSGNAGSLPAIDLNGGYSASLNNARQRFSDGSVREGSNAQNTNANVSLLANWVAFDGFRVYARKDQLEYLQSLGKSNTRFYIEQTVSDIAMAYYQILYEKRLLENDKQSLEISLFRLSMERKRKEVGAGKNADYGQALVDYRNDSIRLLDRQNTIASLQVEINRILGNDLETERRFSDTLFLATDVPEKDSLLKQVEGHNSELAMQKLEELIAETELRLAKADRYPKVNVYGGYQYTESVAEVGFIQSNKNFGPTAGLTVNFNLFNGGNTKREIRNAAINKEKSTLSRQELARNLHAEALKLHGRWLAVRNQLAIAEENVSTVMEVYATAQQQFREGAISGYEFRLTQLSLMNTQIILAQLQFAIQTIEVNVNRISGRIIEAYM